MTFKVPNQFRLRTGNFGSDDSAGNNGMFFIPNKCVSYFVEKPVPLKVVASDGEGWEHVSVSQRLRMPTWDEMNFIKSLFWDDEDCVMQLHPPRSQWINNHPYCLHLWRPVDAAIPVPPSLLVGIKGLEVAMP